MDSNFASFIDDLNVVSTLSSNSNGNRTRTPKTYKPRYNPMELDEIYFRRKYRFTKANMTRVINLVRSDLEGSPRGGHIPADLQVMAAIRYWGRNEVNIFIVPHLARLEKV